MKLDCLHENASITDDEGRTFIVGQKVRLVSELDGGLSDYIKPGDVGTVLYIKGPINGRYSLQIQWDKEILSIKNRPMRPVSILSTYRVEPNV